AVWGGHPKGWLRAAKPLGAARVGRTGCRHGTRCAQGHARRPKNGERGDRKMTTAERVARLLGNDGQRWETEDGKTLDELASEAGAHTETHPDKQYLTRYVFPDGSAIVASEGAWDIEGNEPFS